MPMFAKHLRRFNNIYSIAFGCSLVFNANIQTWDSQAKKCVCTKVYEDTFDKITHIIEMGQKGDDS